MMEADFVTLRIHLSSGEAISLSYQTSEEAEEVAQALHQAIEAGVDERTNRPVPHWHLIDTTLVFTGAVSAIEVD